MKAFDKYKSLFIGIAILSTLFLSSCVSRYLAKEDLLVRNIEFSGFEKSFHAQVKDFIAPSQLPNKTIDLYPYLWFSNNGKRQWGTPPAILDSSLVDLSRIQMERYLRNNGYLDANVSATIHKHTKKQSIDILFSANSGSLYKIKNVSYNIQDTSLKTYIHPQSSSIKSSYIYNSELLAWERDQIYNTLRNNGYVDFDKQYISFLLDSNQTQHTVDVKLELSNQTNGNKHRQFRFGDTYFEVKSKYATYQKDTLLLSNHIYCIANEKRIKSALFAQYVYYKRGAQFSFSDINTANTRLSDIGIFKGVDVRHVPNALDSNYLDTYFTLIPRKRMSNKISGDFNFNDASKGINIGNTFSNFNLLGSGEQISLLLKAGLLSDNTLATSASSRLSNLNYQIGLNLTLPWLLSPFKFFNISEKYGVPKTIISSMYQFYKQRDALDRNILMSSLSYTWLETANKFHRFTPINFELVRGVLADSFRNTLISRGDYGYLYTIDRQVVTLGSQYYYSYNAKRLFTNETFSYFQFSFDIAGHTLQLYDLIFGLPKTSDGFKKILDVPFSQYVRPEIDWRQYWRIAKQQQIVSRFNLGVGVPLGNSSALTLEKYFFAGGFISNRAWTARTLGPGNYIRTGATNDISASIGQFGEIKAEWSTEYRFGIAQFNGININGASFVDMGNIWRLNSEPSYPDGEIQLNKLLHQIAIGVGLGLRMDLSFFVFRFDVGLKAKDPSFNSEKQWVIKDFFSRASAFRAAYLNTYGREYSFLQYNFGIGLPF